jgi:hypothetical protein
MREDTCSSTDAGRTSVLLTRYAAPALALGLLAHVTAAHAQNEDRVKAGLMMWRNSGCADCK